MSAASVASYVWGYCTQFVASTLSWVPAGLGNAKDWLSNAQAKGFQTSGTPHPGDVVVYGAGHGYDPQYGHVAVVKSVQSPTRFTVTEQSVIAGKSVQDTRSSSMLGVLGFIRPPNETNQAASGNMPGNSSKGGIPIPVTNSQGPSLPNPMQGVQDAINNVGTTLNPATWLMSIWNDHIKGSLVRIILLGTGLVLMLMGIRMLFEDDSGNASSTTTSEQSQNKDSTTDEGRNQQNTEAESSAAGEDDAAIAAA